MVSRLASLRRDVSVEMARLALRRLQAKAHLRRPMLTFLLTLEQGCRVYAATPQLRGEGIF
jgi:hypothetical protein